MPYASTPAMRSRYSFIQGGNFMRKITLTASAVNARSLSSKCSRNLKPLALVLVLSSAMNSTARAEVTVKGTLNDRANFVNTLMLCTGGASVSVDVQGIMHVGTGANFYASTLRQYTEEPNEQSHDSTVQRRR